MSSFGKLLTPVVAFIGSYVGPAYWGCFFVGRFGINSENMFLNALERADIHAAEYTLKDGIFKGADLYTISKDNPDAINLLVEILGREPVSAFKEAKLKEFSHVILKLAGELFEIKLESDSKQKAMLQALYDASKVIPTEIGFFGLLEKLKEKAEEIEIVKSETEKVNARQDAEIKLETVSLEVENSSQVDSNHTEHNSSLHSEINHVSDHF